MATGAMPGRTLEFRVRTREADGAAISIFAVPEGIKMESHRRLTACCLLLVFWMSGSGVAASTEKTAAKKAEDFTFQIRPQEIAPGDVAVLQWSIKGATSVIVQEAPDSRAGSLRIIGEFEGSTGRLEVRPTESTTYVILCEGSKTYVCASASVRVRVKRQ